MAKVYSLDQHTFIWGTIPVESGKGPDEFCTWEQITPDATSEVGGDGEVTVNVQNDNRHKVTLTLMKSSTTNDRLSAARLLGKKAGTVTIAPLTIKDLNGTTVFIAPEAWITGPPKQSRGKEAGTLVWEFEAASPDRFDGGN